MYFQANGLLRKSNKMRLMQKLKVITNISLRTSSPRDSESFKQFFVSTIYGINADTKLDYYIFYSLTTIVERYKTKGKMFTKLNTALYLTLQVSILNN